jgi:hypothetical protein
MPLLHRSITAIKEPELVAHVLSDPHYRQTLLNVKGMFTDGGVGLLEQVDLRAFDQGHRGDIDILVIPRGQPEVSTAIQVKRFAATVGIDEDGRDVIGGAYPNRLRKLMADGVRQANLTKRLGFAQVYLWVFVVVDSRSRNNGWYTYDAGDSVLHGRIRQAISPVGLEPSIGLIAFEWTQPMDRPPLELATHGGSLTRLAEVTPQPEALTQRVQGLLMRA